MPYTVNDVYERLLKRIKAGEPFAVLGAPGDRGSCVYDPEVNGGCAIGCFLGPTYDPNMEGQNAQAILERGGFFPDAAALFEGDAAMFREVQRIHDVLGEFGGGERFTHNSHMDDEEEESTGCARLSLVLGHAIKRVVGLPIGGTK